MINVPFKAYNELLNILLDEEERLKFEYVIGSMLTDGRPEQVILQGPARSGKSTLMNIVRKILHSRNFSPRVEFMTERNFNSEIDNDEFVFVESNSRRDYPGAIVVKTTYGSRPTNKIYVLLAEIDREVTGIADHCTDVYLSLGENYFD